MQRRPKQYPRLPWGTSGWSCARRWCPSPRIRFQLHLQRKCQVLLPVRIFQPGQCFSVLILWNSIKKHDHRSRFSIYLRYKFLAFYTISMQIYDNTKRPSDYLFPWTANTIVSGTILIAKHITGMSKCSAWIYWMNKWKKVIPSSCWPSSCSLVFFSHVACHPRVFPHHAICSTWTDYSRSIGQ